jgi:hypothetical protein
MCSLLQEHLADEKGSRFTHGTLKYPDLSRKTRRRIKAQLRLEYHMPDDPPSASGPNNDEIAS